MPGLGFRPLGYSEGDLVNKIWIDFDRVTKSDITPNEMAQYLYDNLDDLEMMAAENPARAKMLEGVKRWSNFDAFMENIMSPRSLPAFEESPIEEGAYRSPETWRQALEEAAGGRRLTDRDMFQNQPFLPFQNELTPASTGEGIFSRLTDQDLTQGYFPNQPFLPFQNELTPAPTRGRISRRTDQDLTKGFLPTQPFRNTLTAAPTGGRVFREVEEMVTPEPSLQNLQAGGYVDRGTMAGELGRRGDLSVRQAGETMFERMKRLRGYAHGGYADGYSAPRGTVAGELPRYGDMSVREEGESMGELAKRHQDQDWYNRMGGGLGSLGRRRGIV